MSGLDERPGKRKEDNINSGFARLFKRIYSSELLRGRVLKFGIFDKRSLGLGVLSAIMSLRYFIISPDSLLPYFLLYWAGLALCCGCMSYERS